MRMIRQYLALNQPVICQSFYAGLFIVVLLLVLGVHQEALYAVDISALASSVFFVFTRPQAKLSQSVRIIGGYALSIAVGAVCYYLDLKLNLDSKMVSPFIGHALYAGLGVSVAMFLMLLLNIQHPPAVGVTLGLIIEPWQGYLLLVVALAVIALCSYKWLLRKSLVNLL